MTSPVFFGYIAIGIPFGLMCVKASYPVWMSPVMSVFMYAGAGQYVAMGLFASGARLASIAITELLVNSRHIVYGLSLIDRFKKAGKRRLYLIFALTDETYSLLTSCRDRDYMKGEKPGEFCGAVALLDHLYWITGGVIGAVAGTLIPFSLEGVDFALTALFAVLLIEQLKKALETAVSRRQAFLPPSIGVCAAAAAIAASRVGLLSSSNILIAAMAAGLLLLMALCGSTREAGSSPLTSRGPAQELDGSILTSHGSIQEPDGSLLTSQEGKKA